MSCPVHVRAAIIVFFTLIVISESRIRYKYRKRPECRDIGPRRFDQLPAIVATGVVDNTFPPIDGSELYAGVVHIKWVFKGPKQLQGNKITVQGFGDPNLCYSTTNRLDVWIIMLDESSDGLYHLNGTLQKVNLHNLDRMKALTRDEPYRRRADITELVCETQYCENNGNCVEEQGLGIISRAHCRCLDSCPTGYAPVCSNAGETFVNECRLRMDSCLRGHNYFTRFTGACEAGRRQRHVRSILPLFSL